MTDPKVSSATWMAFCGAPTNSAPIAIAAPAIATVRVTAAAFDLRAFQMMIVATTIKATPSHVP